MKERPVIFGAESIAAIYARRKTQTRRVVKPPPNNITTKVEWNTANEAFVPWNWTSSGSNSGGSRTGDPIRCPYGVPGDRLWVRETWRPVEADHTNPHGGQFAAYRADSDATDSKWKSPLFMPRWASRLMLEVVAVRVERLQDMSAADLLAEGIPREYDENAVQAWRNRWRAFRQHWDALNAKRGFPWDSNPFLWVVEFRLLTEV